MAADTANRKAARQALATLLDTALVAGGSGLAQAVYNHKRGQFTEGPVVLVYSGPQEREQLGLASERYASQFIIVVDVWVPDANAADGWSEEAVEDALDDINKELADTVADNRTSPGAWDYLEFDTGARSAVMEATDEQGLSWVIERFNILCTIRDG